jgi:hypothetical protein
MEKSRIREQAVRVSVSGEGLILGFCETVVRDTFLFTDVGEGITVIARQ